MEEIIHTFGIDWRLLIIQSLNFALLVFLLWVFLYKPVLRLIDARRAKIAEGVTAAEEAHAARESIEQSKDSILANATVKGEGLVREAREHALGEAKGIIEGAHVRSEGILSDAQLQAEELKRKAQEANQEEIARLAVLAAEKIITEKHAQ